MRWWPVWRGGAWRRLAPRLATGFALPKSHLALFAVGAVNFVLGNAAGPFSDPTLRLAWLPVSCLVMAPLALRLTRGRASRSCW